MGAFYSRTRRSHYAQKANKCPGLSGRLCDWKKELLGVSLSIQGKITPNPLAAVYAFRSRCRTAPQVSPLVPNPPPRMTGSVERKRLYSAQLLMGQLTRNDERGGAGNSRKENSVDRSWDGGCYDCPLLISLCSLFNWLSSPEQPSSRKFRWPSAEARDDARGPRNDPLYCRTLRNLVDLFRARIVRCKCL